MDNALCKGVVANYIVLKGFETTMMGVVFGMLLLMFFFKAVADKQLGCEKFPVIENSSLYIASGSTEANSAYYF